MDLHFNLSSIVLTQCIVPVESLLETISLLSFSLIFHSINNIDMNKYISTTTWTQGSKSHPINQVNHNALSQTQFK